MSNAFLVGEPLKSGLGVGDVSEPAAPVSCMLLLLLPVELPIECLFRILEFARCRSCSVSTVGPTLRLRVRCSFGRCRALRPGPGYAYGALGLFSGAFGLRCFQTISAASSRAASYSFSSSLMSILSMAARISLDSLRSIFRRGSSRYSTLCLRSWEGVTDSRPRGGCTRASPALSTGESESTLELPRRSSCGVGATGGCASAFTSVSLAAWSEAIVGMSCIREFSLLDHVLKCAGGGREPVGRAGRLVRRS